MIQELREAIRAREEQGRQGLRECNGAMVRLGSLAITCPICQGPTTVRKTRLRGGVTLAHGRFQARASERVCAQGCCQDGKPVIQHPADLDRLLLPRSTIGYDVMVHVGVERFLRQQQREQIRAGLAERWGSRSPPAR